MVGIMAGAEPRTSCTVQVYWSN